MYSQTKSIYFVTITSNSAKPLGAADFFSRVLSHIEKNCYFICLRVRLLRVKFCAVKMCNAIQGNDLKHVYIGTDFNFQFYFKSQGCALAVPRKLRHLTLGLGLLRKITGGPAEHFGRSIHCSVQLK